MYSRTGYGRATCEIDGRQMTVELKSVNHRFLDLSFRMPRNLLFLEETARKALGARLARGHVDVFITYQNHRRDARKVCADTTLFEAYAQALEGLTGVGLKDDRTLMSIARLPDVLTTEEAEEDQQAVTALMREALDRALDQLIAMRGREGLEMTGDLGEKLAALENMLRQVEERYPDTVREYKERLKASVVELIGQEMDEARLLQEVAVMADKSAIAEETVRLRSHIGQFRELLQREEPVGRRLDFLVQEMNREVNTISSKSQDVPITRLAVDMKAEIEKLREQLQNVE
ncbi:MAG: YicC family protein [Clostridia bacterium]|nr:YicC family protein [Clostridia bacterium]